MCAGARRDELDSSSDWIRRAGPARTSTYYPSIRGTEMNPKRTRRRVNDRIDSMDAPSPPASEPKSEGVDSPQAFASPVMPNGVESTPAADALPTPATEPTTKAINSPGASVSPVMPNDVES